MTSATAAARRARPRRDDADHPPHRRRRREHVAGDDDQRHLQRERNQLPEAAAPGVDDLRQGGRGRGQRGDDDEHRGDQREDERVGQPALGPGGQRQREARDEAGTIGIGLVGHGSIWSRGAKPVNKSPIAHMGGRADDMPGRSGSLRETGPRERA